MATNAEDTNGDTTDGHYIHRQNQSQTQSLAQTQSRIAFSDYIIYCFDRKFSNFFIASNAFEQKLRDKYPYTVQGVTEFNLSKFRFLRKKNNMFYYLHVEPEDICPFGTTCALTGCNRIHYICEEDICAESTQCASVLCTKVHLHSRSLSDRICSILYRQLSRSPSSAPKLADFMICYEQHYGEFPGYGSLHTSNGMMKELKRVLYEYSNIYMDEAHSSPEHTRAQRCKLWRLNKDNRVQLCAHQTHQRLCAQHLAGDCLYRPNYLCPFIHADKQLAIDFSKCGDVNVNVETPLPPTQARQPLYHNPLTQYDAHALQAMLQQHYARLYSATLNPVAAGGALLVDGGGNATAANMVFKRQTTKKTRNCERGQEKANHSGGDSCTNSSPPTSLDEEEEEREEPLLCLNAMMSSSSSLLLSNGDRTSFKQHVQQAQQQSYQTHQVQQRQATSSSLSSLSMVDMSRCSLPPRDFLHFADQIIDCFNRNFNDNYCMPFGELCNKLKTRFPGRDIIWSKYRFLRVFASKKESGNGTTYIRLKIENEDLCPMGHHCSWFGCARLHHISHQEIIYKNAANLCTNRKKSGFDHKKFLRLPSQQRFCDKMVSILMSECHNRTDMNDKSLSECRFWLTDILEIFRKHFGELDLCGSPTSDQGRSFWVLEYSTRDVQYWADMAAFLHEYGKYYVVNEHNGHTECLQLWYLEYDKASRSLVLKINREITNTICYDHMYHKCHFCPLSFCPWLHVDKRFVAMHDLCSCRLLAMATNGANAAGSSSLSATEDLTYNNNRCKKYHLKSHHLRIAPKQQYGPLSRTLKEIRKYIEAVKLMKVKDEEFVHVNNVAMNGQQVTQLHHQMNHVNGDSIMAMHHHNPQNAMFLQYAMMNPTPTPTLTPMHTSAANLGNIHHLRSSSCSSLDNEDVHSDMESRHRQWCESLRSLQARGVYDLHQPFNYIRVEWLNHDTNYQLLAQNSHLQLIDEFYQLFHKVYNLGVVDVCINGTRINFGLKYEIVRDADATLFNLWQFFRGKSNHTKEWCFNRIVKMKMVDMKGVAAAAGDEGTFVLFELQGMNPMVSIAMAQQWFERKLSQWQFMQAANLQFADGAMQYLVKPKKYASTNHVEIFVYDSANFERYQIPHRFNIFGIDMFMKLATLEDGHNRAYIPWIHQERYFFSDHSNLDTYNTMKMRHLRLMRLKQQSVLTAAAAAAASFSSSTTCDANAQFMQMQTQMYSGGLQSHSPAHSTPPSSRLQTLSTEIIHEDDDDDDCRIPTLSIAVRVADHILDCCSRRFNCGTSYADVEHLLKRRFGSRTNDGNEIEWHKYRFVQTDSDGYCRMNIAPDDVCALGDECRWQQCRRLHHVSHEELCAHNEKCRNRHNGKCGDKLHLHSKRLVDRIASVLLYEVQNYINKDHHTMSDDDDDQKYDLDINNSNASNAADKDSKKEKPLSDCYIFLGKFLVMYQQLYNENFENLIFAMNVAPAHKTQFPERYANIAAFLIEYGQFATHAHDDLNHEQQRQCQSPQSPKSPKSPKSPTSATSATPDEDPDVVGYTQMKQLWNVSMYKDDHTPHITINPELMDLVCYAHMCSKCHYAPYFHCPYLHLDKKFVSTINNCQCTKNVVHLDGGSTTTVVVVAAKCTKFHVTMSRLKRAPKQTYQPLRRSVREITECVQDMQTAVIHTRDDEDKKHELKWQRAVHKHLQAQRSSSSSPEVRQQHPHWRVLDHRHPCVLFTWAKSEQWPSPSFLKVQHEIYKFALATLRVSGVDIHIHGTKKIVALMYKLVLPQQTQQWLQLKRALKAETESVWCFNRVIRVRVHELTLDDGAYVVFEFEPMNTLVSVQQCRHWFEYLALSRLLSGDQKLSSFLTFSHGVVQYMRMQHFSEQANYAQLFVLNDDEVQKTLQHTRAKLCKGKLAVSIAAPGDGDEQTLDGIAFTHRARKFFDHAPPTTVQVLLQLREQRSAAAAAAAAAARTVAAMASGSTATSPISPVFASHHTKHIAHAANGNGYAMRIKQQQQRLLHPHAFYPQQQLQSPLQLQQRPPFIMNGHHPAQPALPPQHSILHPRSLPQQKQVHRNGHMHVNGNGHGHGHGHGHVHMHGQTMAGGGGGGDGGGIRSPFGNWAYSQYDYGHYNNSNSNMPRSSAPISVHELHLHDERVTHRKAYNLVFFDDTKTIAPSIDNRSDHGVDEIVGTVSVADSAHDFFFNNMQ